MNSPSPRDTFNCRDSLALPAGSYSFFSLPRLARTFPAVGKFPYSIRILLEAVLRAESSGEATRKEVEDFLSYEPQAPGDIQIPFVPARVLLQDFTGVPCVVDLAAMRSAVASLGGDPGKINPQIPVDLVIDHSLQVDHYGASDAAAKNVEMEFRRNRERYEFLRWGREAFSNFSVIPPGGGICHQVNLEYLATLVRRTGEKGESLAFPDTVVGTDSHTTMINGLGVLGWGVGGIEAEAAMLGRPLYMPAPAVVGVRLQGRLRPGVTATDLVLTVTELLRRVGVVDKFVEFTGPGAAALSVPDRALVANMAPEYGATMGFFPPDKTSIDYLRRSGRPEDAVVLAESYLKAQGLFRTSGSPEPEFQSLVELDLASVEPSVAGPKRPQDRIPLGKVKKQFTAALSAPVESRGYGLKKSALSASRVFTAPDGGRHKLRHGAVLIASITSCTNTSNPQVMLAAGLLAKKAVKAGLSTRAWVKTSLTPGSRVVTDYLSGSGLLPYLEELGFHVTGYGCGTCIGNSGPLPEEAAAAARGGLVAAAVLSGNRNFEGRVHPLTRANFLASPPLVVAYALAGTVDIDMETEPLGADRDGKPVFLRDIWPGEEEITSLAGAAMDRELFLSCYRGIQSSSPAWNALPVRGGDLYQWDRESSYIQEPPFFRDLTPQVKPIGPIRGARVLVSLGDSVTTDHISPAGSIPPESPAGRYLMGLGVKPEDFNSYGSRRGNDRVMTRGTFANIRLRNLLAPGTEGSATVFHPTGEVMDIFTAAEAYRRAETPTIVLAGKDYGMGSSRDWAAKGAFLLGVRAVIAESYERIHRSNLVGMGVLPLQHLPGESAASLGLTGKEEYHIPLDDGLRPGEELEVTARDGAGEEKTFRVRVRIDVPVEVEYYRNGGLLHTVLRRLVFG